MTRPREEPSQQNSATAQPGDEAPGVPGFRTWRGVYLFVLVCFVVVVGALTLFSHLFA